MPNPRPAVLRHPTGDAVTRHASILPIVARILEEEGVPHVPAAPDRAGERLEACFGDLDLARLYLRWSYHADADDPGEAVFQLSFPGLAGTRWDAAHSTIPCADWDARMPPRIAGVWCANPRTHELFRYLDPHEDWQALFRAMARAYRLAP